MPNIFFTSDYHFSHTNIAGPKVSRWSSGYRIFENTHEMNKTLIEATNKYVQEDDILYFLGDWCFGGHSKTPTYRNYLKCKTIHFIKGNHDGKIELYKNSFTTLSHKLELEIEENRFYLSHHPLDSWCGDARGVIHLFGHCHNTIVGKGKSMDVGVDVAYATYGEWRPFHLNEILDIISKK